MEINNDWYKRYKNQMQTKLNQNKSQFPIDISERVDNDSMPKRIRWILWAVVVIWLIYMICIWSFYFFKIKKTDINSESKTTQTTHTLITSSAEMIPLQKISNVGYTFYLGQIDYPSAAAITDQTKNDITQIIYDAKFSKNLSQNIAIIITNTLAASTNQYFDSPFGKVKMVQLPPVFLQGGGAYSQHIGNLSFIFINKNQLNSSRLNDILTHELGHYIGSLLTAADWEQYYNLRQIPTGTPLYTSNWMLSPGEDFADVYKNVFTKEKVQTYYGLLIKTNDNFPENECGKIYDKLMKNYIAKKYSNTDSWNIPILSVKEADTNITSNKELQDCRRKVLLDSEKYSEDWRFVVPYYSSVSQATKTFVINTINKLNL